MRACARARARDAHATQQKHGVHFPNLLEPSVATRAIFQRPLIFNVRGCVMDLIKFPIIAVDRNNNKFVTVSCFDLRIYFR